MVQPSPSSVARPTGPAPAHEVHKPTHNGHICCPQCGRTSGPERKFCSTCGLSLWEPCLRCKTLTPLGERFCGACGMNLQSAHDAEAERLDAQLQSARKAQAECRFLDAFIALRAVEKCDVPRLRPKVDEALKLIDEFKAEQTAREAKAAGATEEAERLFQENKFQETIAHLELVPERLRSAAQLDLLETARGRVAEITALMAEIKADLAAQRYLELAPKAQRLLGLEPGNEPVKTMLGKLGRKLFEMARERFAAQKYDEAQVYLDATPESAQDANYEKLRQDVDEIVWLASAQRTMPLADATLTAISERLVKLAPSDASVQKIHQRLQQCLAAAKEREGRFQPPSWAKAPATTIFGCSVDPLYGFNRLANPGVASAALKSAPSSFYVAVGLALAALGKGAASINLLPQQEETFLSRFVKLGEEPEKVVAAWGIDLTQTAVKAVRLKLVGEGADEKVEIDQCILIQPDPQESRPTNEMEIRQRKEKLLKTFLAENSPGEKEPIAVGLSGSKTLGRFVDLPPVPDDKVADAVRYEAPHQIPIPLNQLYWGYQLLGEKKPSDAGMSPSRLVLFAAKRHHVDEQLSLFTSAGLKPQVMLGDVLALHNYLVSDQISNDEKDPRRDDPLAIVDVGHDCTNVVISTRHELWFRTIPQGSNDVNLALVKELKLTAAQAEQLKKQPPLARRLSRLYEVIDPWILGLAGEVGRTLTAYANLSRGAKLQRIFGVGGGFQLPGVLRAMRQPG